MKKQLYQILNMLFHTFAEFYFYVPVFVSQITWWNSKKCNRFQTAPSVCFRSALMSFSEKICYTNFKTISITMF